MCSVWVHGPGACVSFAVAKFLVLATEELDCSRRGLQRLPTELDARFASSCVGQANKQRAVAQQTTHHVEEASSGPSNVRFASDPQAVRGRPVVPLQEKGGLERPRVYRVVIGRRVSSACVSHNRRVLDARRGRHVISSAQATGTAPGPTGRRPAATGWTSRGLKFATPAASRARPPR